MPHRTVFQWGKNHVHPFTMFLGGFVIGALVTGVIVYAWMVAEDTGVEVDESTVIEQIDITESPEAEVSPSPTATASVQF